MLPLTEDLLIHVVSLSKSIDSQDKSSRNMYLKYVVYFKRLFL